MGGGGFDHGEHLRYVKETDTACLHANRVAAVRRCARPGISAPGRPEGLPRTAAITNTAGIKNARWMAMGVGAPICNRTCTSVSPFFAMTGRRLGALTARDKFMHSPKSCRKNPSAHHNTQGNAHPVASGLATLSIAHRHEQHRSITTP